MAKIVVVDDHAIFREGIGSLMNQSEKDQVVADLESPENLDDVVSEYQPDVVVIDLSLSGKLAFESIRKLRTRFPALPIVVLSMHGEQAIVDRALSAGANCYALKRDAFQDLMFAIRAAERGGRFISASIMERNSAEDAPGKLNLEELPQRQREIMQLVRQGKANKEIAADLGLALPTVKNHLSALYRKFGVSNRIGLLAKFGLTDFSQL